MFSFCAVLQCCGADISLAFSKCRMLWTNILLLRAPLKNNKHKNYNNPSLSQIDSCQTLPQGVPSIAILFVLDEGLIFVTCFIYVFIHLLVLETGA